MTNFSPPHDANSTEADKTQPATEDDAIITFQLDETSVRGRSIRLGTALHTALGASRYPEPVARLLGEAMMIGAIVAQALKFKGRLVVQCHGTNKGAVSLLVADCSTDGNIRGYARWDEEQLKMITLDSRSPGANTLLGGGTFSMTIDQGPDMDQYQGLAAIEGEHLSECAEHYFHQSEQIPTRIRLACGQIQSPGSELEWRGGGLMIQRVATDTARMETQDDWETAISLFGTLSDAEILDPSVSQSQLLYRLFHENGVRVTEPSPVLAQCSCSRDRLHATLKSFEAKALTDMAEDGVITANCEFCATDYAFNINDLTLYERP